MTKRITLMFIIIIAAIFVMTGCGQNEEVAEDLPAEDVENISIEVVNNTEDIFISYAAFFGPGLEEWGEDLLGDMVIAPGQSFTFELPEAEYNLALFTYELYVVYSGWGINSDTKIELGGENSIPILLENKSDKDVALFFLSPSESGDWGEDLLGDTDVILAETGGRIFFVEPGTYDLMAINIDGETVFDVRDMEIDSHRVLTIN